MIQLDGIITIPKDTYITVRPSGNRFYIVLKDEDSSISLHIYMESEQLQELKRCIDNPDESLIRKRYKDKGGEA